MSGDWFIWGISAQGDTVENAISSMGVPLTLEPRAGAWHPTPRGCDTAHLRLWPGPSKTQESKGLDGSPVNLCKKTEPAF